MKVRFSRSPRSATIVSGVVATAVVAGSMIAMVQTASAAAGAPSYEPDGNALGTVSFYDNSGNPVTSGSLTSVPFVPWLKASTNAPAGSAKAIDAFYTPVQGALPATWQTGEQQSTAQTFPQPGAPGALATSTAPVVHDDGGLDFQTHITDFPSSDSTDPNVYQVRIVVTPSAQYWATDILVDSTAHTWTQLYPTPATGAQTTVTSLTVTPAGHTTPGTGVELTAALTPSSAAGTVQFKDGANNLGAPVAVTAGSATLTTTALTAGTHSLTAVFTPSDTAAFTGSTSSAVTYEIVADASALTISKSTSIAYGKSTTIAAKLSDVTTHANISGATITLLSRTSTAKPFATVKSVKTTSAGAASLTVAPKAKTYYEWKYAGSATHAAKTSASETVSVAKVVTAAAKATKPKKNAKFKVYGTVAPALSKLKVTLQQKVGAKWKTIASATTKSQKLPTGKKKVGFVFTLKEKKKGKFSFRVVAAATSTLSAGTSKTVTVHVV